MQEAHTLTPLIRGDQVSETLVAHIASHAKIMEADDMECANTLRDRIETKLLSQGQDALLNLIACDYLLPETITVSGKAINIDYFVIEENSDYIIQVFIGGDFISKAIFDIIIPK